MNERRNFLDCGGLPPLSALTGTRLLVESGSQVFASALVPHSEKNTQVKLALGFDAIALGRRIRSCAKYKVLFTLEIKRITTTSFTHHLNLRATVLHAPKISTALGQPRHPAQHLNERRAIHIRQPLLIGGLLQLRPQARHQHRCTEARALFQRESRILK